MIRAVTHHAPIDVHVHVHYDEADLGQVLAKLEQMESTMANVQAALDAMKARVNEDMQHMRDLLDQALATETSNQAEIDRLRAEAEVVANSLNAFDPDASWPSAPPQPDVPEPTPEPTPEPAPVEEPPAEPQP